jgi:hypothetical protein
MNDVKRGFKKKTIEADIRSKMAKWIATIEDEQLRDDVKANYIVTGGAIASMLMGDVPNDYDVYFQDADVAARLARYYVGKLSDSGNDKTSAPVITVPETRDRVEIRVQSSGVAGEDVDQSKYDYFEHYVDGADRASAYLDAMASKDTGKYTALAITTNAITLSDKVQLILRFVGTPETIHHNYDFVHATNWFTHSHGLVLRVEALESILARELKYVGSRYPICSMFRLKKFINRGWTITAGEMLKIAWDISKLDLEDREVLQDQLTGVDAAYFRQIISLLAESGKPIERTYLFELINRIFDEEQEVLEKIDTPAEQVNWGSMLQTFLDTGVKPNIPNPR